MEGTSKQHGDMTDQAKRYTFISNDSQLHTGHAGNTSISSCQNSGGYTDTLTYKKSVRIFARTCHFRYGILTLEISTSEIPLEEQSGG